jgi:hypothetical protein
MQSSSSAEIMSGFGKWTKGEEEFPLHPSAKTPRERLFLELEIGVVSLDAINWTANCLHVFVAAIV